MKVKGAVVVATEEMNLPIEESEGDVRKDEIVLDHALAKSSNVTSPVKEVVDLEDDFFSMSYTPTFVETKKKKKKKNKKKVKSPSPIVKPVVEEDASLILLSEPEVVEDDSLIEIPAEVTQIPMKRPITPPPIDKETFKQMYKKQHQQEQQEEEPYIEKDLDNIKERLNFLNKISTNVQPDVEAKDTRVYNLHITSYLPGSENLPVLTLQVKGNKQLNSVVKKVLQHFKQLQVIPENLVHLFDEKNVVLYWNKMQLMSFMKLDSLLIPETEEVETEVEMVLYSKNQLEEIRRNERLELQERLERKRKDEELELMLKQRAEEKLKEEQEEIEYSQPEAQDINDYFKIGLKGEDNYKIIIEVSPETKLEDIVKYYLKTKKLPESTKVKLVFDDEELEITGTIADTELEEDFTVDVYII